MKAVLKFDLPEDKEEFGMAVKGSRYYCAIWDMYNCLRTKLKHEELDDREAMIIQQMYKKFFEILEDNGLSLEPCD